MFRHFRRNCKSLLFVRKTAESVIKQFFPKSTVLSFYLLVSIGITAQKAKMKFSIKHFFRKCDQIRYFLRIWSHLLKKTLMENFFLVQCRTLLSGSILDLFINYEISLKKETDAEKLSSREKNHEFFDIKF